VNIPESALTKRIFQNQPSQREYFRISHHKENISKSALTKRIQYSRISPHKENISESALTIEYFRSFFILISPADFSPQS
jgi:hypothetical protein